jgi:Raf kinase inhibitor-like YbhB/YbcL family protein
MKINRISPKVLTNSRKLMIIAVMTVLSFFSTIASGGVPMKFEITSAAFRHMGSIPSEYTCEGRNISPPLSWQSLPDGTKSLVLIVDDPDAPDPGAPRMTWIHWVLYNMPPDTRGIAEGIATPSLPVGTLEGLNSLNRAGYSGPCPPVGKHRYFHKLYALDTMLPLLSLPTKAAIENAMKSHIIGEAVLIGTYAKRK